MATVAIQNAAAAWQHHGSQRDSSSYHHQQKASSPSAAKTSQHTSRPSSSSNARKSSRSSGQYETHDRFYGERELAELCEHVILCLYSCPLDSTSSGAGSPSAPTHENAPRLAEFIAYALHRTRLPLAVTHQALFLLRRLKARFPGARGSSGHRLFISALMLASKASCDDTYSNKSWTIVGQGLFSLSEINQMERELFGYIGYHVNVTPEELEEFVQSLEDGSFEVTPEVATPVLSGQQTPTVTTADLTSRSRLESAPVAHSEQRHLAPAMVPSSSPAVAAMPSPSAVSEPTFEPPTQRRPLRQREGSAVSTGPHRIPRAARHLQHPHTSAAAFNRASIAGYPSMMAAQQRSMSLNGAASSSESSLDRVAQGFYQGGASNVQIHVNDESSTSAHSPSTDVQMRNGGFTTSSAAPYVPMQGFYSSSPSATSLASSSRGSMSSAYGASDGYIPSPYASHLSSNSTTPETQSSEFGSPNNSDEDEDEDFVSSLEAPLGAASSYDSVWSKDQWHHHHQQQHQHQHQAREDRHRGPIFSPHYSMAPPEQQKATMRFQQHQQNQRQRLDVPRPSWA